MYINPKRMRVDEMTAEQKYEIMEVAFCGYLVAIRNYSKEQAIAIIARSCTADQIALETVN